MRRIKVTKTVDIVFEIDDEYLQYDFRLIDFIRNTNCKEVTKAEGFPYNEYILDNGDIKNIKIYKKDTDIINERDVERTITKKEYEKAKKELTKFCFIQKPSVE